MHLINKNNGGNREFTQHEQPLHFQIEFKYTCISCEEDKSLQVTFS